jgi:geranylgeranyl diphosphate synthase type I
MDLETYLPAIETALQQAVAPLEEGYTNELYHMMCYHLGWEGEGAGVEARGKRIRPLLVVICTAAAGGNWRTALPAAVAVELVHNFSLIHDDIEDNSPLRRGRPTLWKIWGIPQAINTGDAMFTLAYVTLLELERELPTVTVLAATRTLQRACLLLTEGQHLDLAYESRNDLPLDAYWPMVKGKTAALLSACTRLGALVAEAPESIVESYEFFGRDLGLAFQAQDDLLGIWGDAALTGKSAESDLVSGKKSLPVLYGLSKEGEFAQRWTQGPIKPREVPQLAKQLKQAGAYDYTKSRANQLTEQALAELEKAQPQGEAGQALRSLAHKLLHRQG